MEIKIVVITSEYLHPFVTDTFGQIILEGVAFEVVKYQNFQHIARLYAEHEDVADGFMVSGNTAQAAIEKAYPSHKKPIVAFQADSACLYRLLLERFLEDRALDPDRVIFDFLLAFSEDATVEYFLYRTHMPEIAAKVAAWFEGISIDDIAVVEARMAQKILALWQAGKMDLVICQYSSNIPFLEAHGIPYSYPYPEKEQLAALADSLVSQVELRRMRENLPAVVSVRFAGPEGTQTQRTALKEALRSIKRELVLDFLVQENESGCYLFTSVKVIHFLTADLRICHLNNTLQEKHGLAVAVGYGIGKTIADAIVNSDDALKESLLGKGSFVVDEDHRLMGPLNTEEYLEVQKQLSETVYTAAERCKLSTLTIQKLISIRKLTGSSKLTTQDLAERMGVTVRNANRILSSLEKGGAASVAYTQSPTSKGRPVKVYELRL